MQLASKSPAPPPGNTPAAAAPPTLSQDEQFSARAGSDNPPVAHAVNLEHPEQTVVQGAII